jgi:predicted permease
VVVIAASTPAAAMLTMMADKYSSEKALPAAVVAAETVLSVLTMPVIVGLAVALAK